MTQRTTLIIAIFSAYVSFFAWSQTPAGGYPYTPVPFTSVKVTDAFWGQQLKTSREVTIPIAFDRCEQYGRYDRFVFAAHPSPTNKVEGTVFDDTDVYKIIEGASYSMQTHPDPALAAYVDSILTLVEAAQEPDGYLYTARTINPQHPHRVAGTKRWEKVEEHSHEFYNLGHMIDGAVAHYQATGNRKFLDVAIRYADCVEREIGEGAGQQVRVPGHQIVEMALCRLYLVTKERKYLDLAKFFLDKRGYTYNKSEYSQSHLPVLEQKEAVGHAVRAVYMYSGMADVAALTGDQGYINAIDSIWDNVVTKKYYITGGIGALHRGEAFGENYHLPNHSAYCETCAAIGNVYWNHRLFLLHGDAKYYDVLERSLYNGVLPGVSLTGDTFFYPNPLDASGDYERKEWFGVSCCPSNLSRFIPSLPGYIYAVKDSDLYVNLFMGNTSEVEVAGKKVKLTQTTCYPWDGAITLQVDPKSRHTFSLKIRIPGWATNRPVPGDLYAYTDGKQPDYQISINGEPAESTLEKGFFTLTRQWRKGDKVEIRFEMEPRLVEANDLVRADRGKVAVERGPLVYCAESPDNDFDIHHILLSGSPRIRTEESPELLGGIIRLQMPAQLCRYNSDGKLTLQDVSLRMIPYYTWANRGASKMRVWMPRNLMEGWLDSD